MTFSSKVVSGLQCPSFQGAFELMFITCCHFFSCSTVGVSNCALGLNEIREVVSPQSPRDSWSIPNLKALGEHWDISREAQSTWQMSLLNQLNFTPMKCWTIGRSIVTSLTWLRVFCCGEVAPTSAYSARTFRFGSLSTLWFFLPQSLLVWNTLSFCLQCFSTCSHMAYYVLTTMHAPTLRRGVVWDLSCSVWDHLDVQLSPEQALKGPKRGTDWTHTRWEFSFSFKWQPPPELFELILFLLHLLKANRVTCFLYQFMKTGLNVYRVYSKNTPVDISTVSSSGGLFSNMYKDYLYYAHVMLKSELAPLFCVYWLASIVTLS